MVDATSGVRQGDPLGPLFFAMALDDVSLIGPRERVEAALLLLTELARRIGLRVNAMKSRLAEMFQEQTAVLEQIVHFDVKHALMQQRRSLQYLTARLTAHC